MLLWYIVPSFASFLEISEMFCLLKCDRRRLNVTADFLFLSMVVLLSIVRLNSLQKNPGSMLRASKVWGI